MEAGKGFYSSKNYLYWIYEYEGECYLINNLPLWHLPLLFLGFYRASIFKLKAKKISVEEAQKYQNKGREKNGPLRTLLIPVIMAGAGYPLVASNIRNQLEQSTAFFSIEFFVILIVSYYLILLAVVLLYRKKYGFYKFRVDEAKIKVKMKDKKITTWILYHFTNLILLNTIFIPFTKISEILEMGGANAATFYTVIGAMIMLPMLIIVPMNVGFGDLEVIKMKK